MQEEQKVSTDDSVKKKLNVEIQKSADMNKNENQN